jgi:hypothetical protein
MDWEGYKESDLKGLKRAYLEKDERLKLKGM